MRVSVYVLRMILTGLLCVGIAGCASLDKGDKSEGGSGDAKQLAYGISITVPADWNIDMITEEGTIPTDEIKKKIASGARLELLSMHKKDEKGEVVAKGDVILVNSARTYLPEAEMLQATPEMFIQYSEFVLQQHREVAAKNKKENQTLEWQVTRQEVDGNLTIFQSALGRRSSGGNMRLMSYDVYLPNSVGLTVSLRGHQEVPNLEAEFAAIAASVRIKKISE